MKILSNNYDRLSSSGNVISQDDPGYLGDAEETLAV